MLQKLRAGLGIALALTLSASLAEAASIVSAQVLNAPAGGKFGLGDLIDVQIAFDFQGGKTFGGGLELDFDTRLVSVESFELDPRWGFDPADPNSSFSRPLGFFHERPRALAVGDFNPFRGPGIVGRLVLRAIAMGDGSLSPGRTTRPQGRSSTRRAASWR